MCGRGVRCAAVCVALRVTTVAAAAEQLPRSCGQAVSYVRSKYRAESINTSRSSFVTSAEYYGARGEGYLIMGLRGHRHIYRGVPPAVWERFKAADSFGRFYNQHIKGRYLVDCRPP